MILLVEAKWPVPHLSIVIPASRDTVALELTLAAALEPAGPAGCPAGQPAGRPGAGQAPAPAGRPARVNYVHIIHCI